MESKHERHAWPNKKHLIHFICWAILIFLEVIVGGAINNRYSSPYYYFFFYALNISLFYAHANLVMRFAKFPNTIALLRFLVVLSCQLIIYIFLSVCTSLFLEYVVKTKSSRALTFDFRYFAVVFYRLALFTAYGTGFYFIKDYLKSEKARMQQNLENEQLRTSLVTIEKDYLRAQINPHLLYNTLSFIKVNAIRSPEQADDAIEKFTLIMDYALESNKEIFVPLSREIEHAEYLIALNQLRYAQKLNLKFSKNIKNHQCKILPIILLTLVENLFKHGNLLDPSNPALIELGTNAEQITFHTRNLIRDKLKNKRESTGLRNIEQRLARSYPGQYVFSYGREDKFFHTSLTISISNTGETVPNKD